jgi:hypothetical protein
LVRTAFPQNEHAGPVDERRGAAVEADVDHAILTTGRSGPETVGPGSLAFEELERQHPSACSIGYLEQGRRGLLRVTRNHLMKLSMTLCVES